MILSMWSINVPPVKNTSMRLLLHRYTHGSIQMVNRSEFITDYAGPFRCEMFSVVVGAFSTWVKLPL